MGDPLRLPEVATVSIVTGWVRPLSCRGRRALTTRLADDPWLDHLLPAIFELPAIGACLDDTWPPALARLAATGRIDRATLLRLVLRRLREGDKPGALRSMLEIHRRLDPALGELTTHASDYLALLGGPPAVAAAGQQALRVLDDAGRLDLS